MGAHAGPDRHGLTNFVWHDRVGDAAYADSTDMAARRGMGHFGSDGSDTGTRPDGSPYWTLVVAG